MFSEDAIFSQAAVALQRRKPSYSIDVRIDAAVQKNVLTETYTIECVPEAGRVDRLLVHLSHPRESHLEWNLAGGNSGQFSARKMSTGEQARTALPPEGEVWELNLQLARPGAFELRGVRSTPLVEETPDFLGVGGRRRHSARNPGDSRAGRLGFVDQEPSTSSGARRTARRRPLSNRAGRVPLPACRATT